jgi:hypothetical protein
VFCANETIEQINWNCGYDQVMKMKGAMKINWSNLIENFLNSGGGMYPPKA